MKTKPAPSSEKSFGCETCPMRQKAEANPKSFMARLWLFARFLGDEMVRWVMAVLVLHWPKIAY